MVQRAARQVLARVVDAGKWWPERLLNPSAQLPEPHVLGRGRGALLPSQPAGIPLEWPSPAA